MRLGDGAELVPDAAVPNNGVSRALICLENNDFRFHFALIIWSGYFLVCIRSMSPNSPLIDMSKSTTLPTNTAMTTASTARFAIHSKMDILPPVVAGEDQHLPGAGSDDPLKLPQLERDTS